MFYSQTTNLIDVKWEDVDGKGNTGKCGPVKSPYLDTSHAVTPATFSSSDTKKFYLSFVKVLPVQTGTSFLIKEREVLGNFVFLEIIYEENK